MGLFDKLNGLFVSQNRQVVYWQDIDYKAKKVYLKRSSVDKVLNFVARTFSEGRFVFRKNGEVINDPWEYILNVRPNYNQSSSEFWKQAIYTLLFENELLIVKTDDDQLLVAEYFDKSDWTLYPTSFKNVKVGNYIFERQFNMNDVIYVTYNNEELSLLIDGLFDDFSEVFESLMGAIKRNNQIRGVINIEKTGTFKDNNSVDRMQRQIEKMLRSFNQDSVAVAPMTNGMNYEETSNKGSIKQQSFSDIDNLLSHLVDEVAEIVGVPSSLIKGDKSNLDSNLKAYKRLCINPLVKLIENELNAKIISKTQYKQSKRVVLTDIVKPDAFDLAGDTERLISSGVLTPNEARELLGFEKVDDDMMDTHFITKNYTHDMKGGGNDSENNQD